MSDLIHLFQNNRDWSARTLSVDPDFFVRLSKQQSPKYLWIGCSDSRVPANEIIGLAPGEVFVHRNVANLVVHSDLNCLSVIQFAVDMLGVEDIMVVGHYGCGGVAAALEQRRIGLADNWLRHLGDTSLRYEPYLNSITDLVDRNDRLCEINVIEQVVNVCRTSVVQDAWRRGKKLTVHSWVYGLKDGLVRDLGLSVSSLDELGRCYQQAMTAFQM